MTVLRWLPTVVLPAQILSIGLALWTRRTYKRLIRLENSRPEGMGIPPEIACPHCHGYVRGHQWIGAQDCSVNNYGWSG